MKNTTSWIVGALVYSFFIAFIPGVITVLSRILNLIDNVVGGWFWSTSWGTKILVYIVIGLVAQWFRPLKKL